MVGEDVSELLDMIAAQLKVIEIARIKKSCRRCEKMVQEPAPSRPIPRSMAGPSLLAFILVSKFDDHVPLYRLNEIFSRMGADIPDTTMVDWCGGAMKSLAPLIEKIETDIMASDLLHADDTPIRVLDRSAKKQGLGKAVKQGRIWVYARDQRPWAGRLHPARSTISRPTGRANIPESISRPAAASCKLMPIPASRSYTSAAPMAPPSSAKPRAGRISAAISTTSGPPRNPRSRRKLSTASVRSMTSSARSTASPPICASRPPGEKQTQGRRLPCLGRKDN